MYKQILKGILIVTTTSLVFPPKTYAYIDPGSGSYVFQIVLTILFTAVITTKTYWKKMLIFIKTLVIKLIKTKNAEGK